MVTKLFTVSVVALNYSDGKAYSVGFSGALRKFFQVIRLEKKEVSAIYFYSILSGLIQLSLPLGIQAIINFAQAAAGSGRLPISIGILIALVLGGVLVAGILQVNQMKIIEKFSRDFYPLCI